jgi:hypothetical protein
MKNFLPSFFLVLVAPFCTAQVVLENNPPGLKWYQINTPNFRILFPRGFDGQALRMANTLEHIRDAEAKSLGAAPRRISIILQNQSAISNGFVSVLPRRSEFYAMPAQDYNFIGTNDWLNTLAAHEYRHIVQYQHATRGFNKAFYYLFGATTLAGMAQAAAPSWFWEGDAVVTETAFTPSGRGKIPNFGLVFRTNLLEGRTFNYHKQYLRSYKHHIPDHYVLGYHMVSYLRKRTNDPEIWGKITARSWSVPFIPFAFSNAIKKETGLYVTDLYREMAKDFKQEWQARMDTLKLSPFEKINHRKGKVYTDYLYPQLMEDGSVLVMKSGIGNIQEFVVINEGKEKKFFTPGYVNDAGMLSVANDRVVWAEYGFDSRWNVRNYSLIKTFDRKNKKTVVRSKKERFGSAAISPDGKKIVAIRTGTDYKTTVLVLDFASGSVLKEFSNEPNHFYTMPRWSADGNHIAVLKTTPEGKTISVLNFESGTASDVLPVSQENVGHPVPYGDFILYNSGISGIDNIYALKISTGEKFQVTSSRYGAYNPAISKDGKTIYYNDQQKNGMDVVKTEFRPGLWSRVQPAPLDNSYQHLVEQEGNPTLFQTVPSTAYPISKYSRLKGIINPYTWGLNVETDLTQALVGISSKDLLSTTAIDLGYIFDINERTGAWRAQVSYQGWFPIIDVSASIADRSVNEGDIDFLRVVGPDTLEVRDNLTFKWQETNVEGGLRIPLNTTHSKFSSNVSFANYVGFTSVSGFRNSIDEGGRIVPSDPNLSRYFFRSYVDGGSLVYNHFNIFAYRLLKQSRRDINSKWGQRILLHYYNTPFGGDYSGGLFSVYGLAYFPGLFKHHSLWGYWAYQRSQIDAASIETGEGLNNYLFRNQIPLPRGQSISRFQEFYSMSANYSLPVWYPDVAVGPIVNFQRLRANVFFDYGFGQSKTFAVSRMYSSVGAEVKLDINIMRFLPQFDIGFRFTKGLDPATSEYELLIGTFNF